MEAKSLIAELKIGNEAAQHAFWDQHWNDIYPMCKHILENSADAADITTAVLSDFMMRYVHQIEHPEALTSYLRLTAARRALRQKEATKRRAEKLQEIDPSEIADLDHASIEEHALIAALQPQLDHCLGQLRSNAQQVLRLRFYGDMSNQRIATLLGVSKQYIGRLVTRSLEALRRCLERVTVKGSRGGSDHA